MIAVIIFNVYFILHWILLMLVSVNFKAKIFHTIISMLCTLLKQESLFHEYQEQANQKELESQVKGTTKFNLKETKHNKETERKKVQKPAGILKRKKKKAKENKEDLKEDNDQVFWVIGEGNTSNRNLDVHELKIKEEELSQIINWDVAESNDSYKLFIHQQKKRLTQQLNFDISSRKESSSDIFIPVVIEKDANKNEDAAATGDRIFDNNSSTSFKNIFGGKLKRKKNKGDKRSRVKKAKK